MPSMKKRMEDLLFDKGTINRTDFCGGKIKPPVKTVYQEKPRCIGIRPPPLKNIHTLSNWKTAAIPFDLLHKPRDIIDVNPRKVQKAYTKPPDLEREEVQKTRPRLVMTPAVSMDDITDPRARSILCEDMYTSDMTRGLREAVSEYFTVRAPFPGLPAPANPILLTKLKPPQVPLEWRKETITWDNKQLRAHCDPTKEFWLAHKLSKCRPCEEYATVKAHRTMLRQLKSGQH